VVAVPLSPAEPDTPAREAVLGRIRAALADVPADPGDGAAVARDYRLRDDADPATLLARFAERVADYQATVRRVAPAALPAAIAAACHARGARRLVVPADLPPAWRPDGVELLEDGQPKTSAHDQDHVIPEGDQVGRHGHARTSLANDVLDGVDGVLTGCRLGIAETGTIVLDGGARQGRRAITLVPDWHLCVVEAGQLVGTVPEAVAALEPAARAGQPITLVSGPSATSDIELSRVEGVHGPRTLEVLLVGTA
jgi:L-lactate dehydrogenase complex protein LldG